MLQGSRRRFGITTNVSGLNQGIVINNLSLDQNLQSAQARNEKGRILDIAVYGDEKTVAIDGLYTGDNVGPGTILKIENTNFVVTSTGKNEINTGFQTANINARYFSGEDPGPGPGPGPEPIIPNPSLSFKAVENGGASIQLNQYGSPDAVNLLYRKNNQSWSTYNIGDVINLDKGDIIFLSGANDHFSTGQNDFYYFTIAGDVEAEGNIMSLMNFSESCTNYCYNQLFRDCDDLLTAPQLPASTLAENCYEGVFAFCSSLISAPVLPATELAFQCYRAMFANCTSLTSAPQLPATTLAQQCYGSMFSNCPSLSTAPALPATSLAIDCYHSMFAYCTSLTVAPDLPAAELTTACYNMMFNNCSNLSSINVNFTDWNVWGATEGWVDNVADQGIFYKPSALSAEYGYSRIPTNWQVVNKVQNPSLTFKAINGPATVLLTGRINYSSLTSIPAINMKYSKNNSDWTNYSIGEEIQLNQGDTVAFSGNNSRINASSSTTNNIWPDYYHKFITSGSDLKVYGQIYSLVNFMSYVNYQFEYYSLFNSCKNIVDASKLQLGQYTRGWCYERMFNNCSSLTAVPSLGIRNDSQYLSQGCYSSMFRGCSSLVSVPLDYFGLARPYTRSCEGMFADCTSLTAAPNLPSGTLYSDCFASMFNGCSSLVEAPQLPATTLAWGCYRYMFEDCTSLTAAPVLPATELKGYCYYEMFRNCTSLTVAPDLPATSLMSSCYWNMFSYCSNLSSINVSFTDWINHGWEDSTNPFDIYKQYFGSWVLGVADQGIFYKPYTLSAEYGTDRIPTNWQVVNKDQPVIDYTPLTFKGLSSSNAVQLRKQDSPSAIILDYSKNNGPWTTYNVGDIIELNQNETIAFSGNNDHFSSNNGFYYFHMSGTIEASGNIQSLMNFSNNCTERCYMDLFQVCRQLVTAPDLPATGLAQECYWSMFADCTNLTDAPQLPATTLVNGCYTDMFDNCTSLTAAPQLPATTLAWGCYADMFYGCSHLSTAPYLPATSLVYYCYAEMFYGCSQLNVLSVNFTEWSQQIAAVTQEWVHGVKNHGDFYKPYNLSTTFGSNYIPDNWTVHNK